MKLKEKFREKKSKCFGWKFKVKDFAKFVFTVRGFYINLQVKITGKKMKIFKVFSGWVFEVKIALC